MDRPTFQLFLTTPTEKCHMQTPVSDSFSRKWVTLNWVGATFVFQRKIYWLPLRDADFHQGVISYLCLDDGSLSASCHLSLVLIQWSTFSLGGCEGGAISVPGFGSVCRQRPLSWTRSYSDFLLPTALPAPPERLIPIRRASGIDCDLEKWPRFSLTLSP